VPLVTHTVKFGNVLSVIMIEKIIWIFKYLYFKNIISQTIDHNRYSEIHLTWNTIYQNGYINYRQAFFTNLENTFSFLTLTAKIRQYKYDNNNKNYNEMALSKWSKSFWNFITYLTLNLRKL
jgi:hypothetical protein